MNENILSRKGFSLDRLAGFCAVAKAGSIVGASKGDVARQSLLSRQIRELEECFGTELVRRQGRGLVITESGRQLAALGRRQFDALDDFSAAASNQPIRVSMAAPESAFQWIILPRLAALRAAEPRATFAIHHEENDAIAPRVQEGVYDFGFVRKNVERGEKSAVALGRFEYVLAAPRSLVRGRDWSLAQALHQLPLALPIAGSMRDAIESYVAKSGRQTLDVLLDYTSYLHATAALRSGACAAVIPTVALAEFPTDRFTTWSLAPLKLERPPFSLIWNPRNAAVRPVVASLEEIMRKVLAF